MRDIFENALGELSSPALDILERFSRIRTLDANSVVYYQDDITQHIFLVKSGYVRLAHILEDGSVTLYGILPPGQTFGEAGTFDQFGYCDTASTVTNAEVIAVGLGWVKEVGPSHDELRMAVAKMIAKRHRDHISTTKALYLPNLSARLSQCLMGLFDSLGNRIQYQGREVMCLGPMVTQKDLGAMARGTRENVNKILKKWIDEGVIVVEDRHIIALDLGRLDRMAFTN